MYLKNAILIEGTPEELAAVRQKLESETITDNEIAQLYWKDRPINLFGFREEIAELLGEIFQNGAEFLLATYRKLFMNPLLSPEVVDEIDKRLMEFDHELADRNPLDWPVETFDWSKRSRQLLSDNGLKTIGDIESMSQEELLGLPGFGRKALAEVNENLDKLGIDLPRRKRRSL